MWWHCTTCYIIWGRPACTELQYCPLIAPASCNTQTAAFALHEAPSRACCTSTRCIVTWPLSHKLCSNLYFHHLASALYSNRQDLHGLLSWYYGCPLYRVPQQFIVKEYLSNRKIESAGNLESGCPLQLNLHFIKQSRGAHRFCARSSSRGEDTIRWTPVGHWHWMNIRIRS